MNSRLLRHMLVLLCLTPVFPIRGYCAWETVTDGEQALQFAASCVTDILGEYAETSGGTFTLRFSGTHRPAKQSRTGIEAAITALGLSIAPTASSSIPAVTVNVTDARTVYRENGDGTYTRLSSVTATVTVQSADGVILHAASKTASAKDTVSSERLEAFDTLGRYFDNASRHTVRRKSLIPNLVSLAALMSALAVFAFRD